MTIKCSELEIEGNVKWQASIWIAETKVHLFSHPSDSDTEAIGKIIKVAAEEGLVKIEYKFRAEDHSKSQNRRLKIQKGIE
jgi:hypothetical protein